MIYFLPMSQTKTKLIAIFVAFSVTFASLWAMSPEAVADTIKEDAGYFHQEVQKVHQNQNTHDQVTQNQTCNHGCHIACHLLGFSEMNPVNVFAFNESSIVFPYINHLLENPLLQGPYRPPISLSLI